MRWRSAVLLVLVTPTLAGCVGTLVKDLAADPATLSIEVTNAIYGSIRVQRSNVQRGAALINKEGLRVESGLLCPEVKP